METVECGAASLGIILGYFGKFVPLDELRTACGISRDGSKASYLVKAAKAYGLEYKAYKSNLEKLLLEKGPFIVFWKFNHFLVVEGFSRNQAYLNDPASGRRRVSLDEFDESFTGVVLKFEKGHGFQPGGKPFSAAGSLKKWIHTGKREFRMLAALGILAIFPGMVLPVFSKVFVDQLIVAGLSNWIWPFFWGMLGCILIKSAMEWMQISILEKLEIKFSALFGSAFLHKILSLPSQFYLNRSSTEVAGRMQALREVSTFITGDFASTLLGLTGLLFYFLILLFYNLPLALISAVLALTSFFLLYYMAKKKQNDSQLLAQDEGKLAAVTVNGFSMLETLRAGGREYEFLKKWNGLLARVVGIQQGIARLNSRLNILPQLLFTLNMIVILYWGGHLVMQGAMTMGVLLAFTVFIHAFYKPILDLVRLGTGIQELQGKLVRVDEMFEKELPETASGNETRAGEKGLRIRGLDFGYNRMQEPLFRELEITINPGEQVAFVGSSGSGKSTLAKLITGIYRPWSGDIRLDGEDIHSLPESALAGRLAVVDQDLFFFEGKIRDILTLWNQEISEEEIIRACKDACIHDAIISRPLGYYGYLKEGGSNFSGGQRQRLEIARALMRNPDYLILDEATSALDPMTEKNILEKLRERACTIIHIAHRLSTIRDCDRIFVLEKGRIVEEGTHDQLIKLNGRYTTLVKSGE